MWITYNNKKKQKKSEHKGQTNSKSIANKINILNDKYDEHLKLINVGKEHSIYETLRRKWWRDGWKCMVVDLKS